MLDGTEMGNDRTSLPDWRSGNAVEALVHGRSYFPRLLEALQGAGPGDLVMFADWRGRMDIPRD